MVNVMESSARKIKDLGDLQDLLIAACPPDEHGNKSISILAAALGTSHQNLYKCIDQKRIPTAHQLPKRIIEISGGRVTHEDLLPFLNIM